MDKNKRRFIVLSIIVAIIIMFFIVLSATIMNIVKYPNDNSPTCNVDESTIVVFCNQKDRIRFKKVQ